MKTNKILAIVLAFAMVLTTMSTVVFADSNVVEAGTYDALVTAAAANAKTGNTIKLTGDITVPAGGKVTLDGVNLVATGTVTNSGTIEVAGEASLNITTLAGNSVDFLDGAIIKDSTIGGEVFVVGNVTFRGKNTFAMIYDFGTLTDYYGTSANMEWTVEQGACVTLTNKDRYGLGYGDKVTVNGNIANALTARDTLTADDLSLSMHGMVGQESKGWNQNSSLTVNNAYVKIGDNNSFGNKVGGYGGNYTYTINNSVVDASRITFYAADSKTSFNITNSDVKMGTFMTRDADSVFTITDSKVLSTTASNGNDEGNYHAGTLKLVNSELTYSAPVKIEGGKLTLDANSKITAPSISGAGKIEIDAGDYDGSSDLTLINADLKGFTGEIEVVNNDGAAYTVDANGKLVLINYVAQIGSKKYTTLQEAMDKITTTTGTVTIDILADVDATGYKGVEWNSYPAEQANDIIINGNDYKITNLTDMLITGSWTGSSLTINDLTIDGANIVVEPNDESKSLGVGAFIANISAVDEVVFDNCHIVNSHIEGGHWTGGFFGFAEGWNVVNDGPVFTNVLVKDSSIKASTVTGKGSAGGVVGHGARNAWTSITLENTEISGNTITSTGDSDNKAGSVCGTIGTSESTNHFGKDELAGIFVDADIENNNVTSNGVAITTIYGRQGTTGAQGGSTTITGGTYDSYPIGTEAAFASVAEGFKLNSNGNGKYIVVEGADIAEELEIVIKKTSETDAEIYVVSTDGNIINRLTAAGLKFYIDTFDADGNKDEEAKVTYTLTPAEDIAITADLEVADAYAFNYTGENIADLSDTEIKLATVKFEGYRDYEFGVDSTYNATKVSTTSFKDNIEKTYTPGGVLTGTTGNLVIDTDAAIKGEIVETTRALKVNIAFNNEIKDQSVAYTDMKVRVVGSNGYDETIELGSANATGETVTSFVADFGAVAVPYRYTVTVTGAGYRTATATAVVGEDTTPDDTTDDVFTFNFWNNVKDAANTSIFVGGDTMTKNFLAGDIVKDNTINKYDLSAVVSYFGTRTAAVELNKYDLNRDGNIDSEDIAYVLVSFGE